MADILTADSPAPAGAVSSEAASEAGKYSRSGDMLKARMPAMVKGAGYVGGGNAPLSDEVQILTKASQAALDLRTETHRGYHDKPSVVKGMNQGFLSQFGYLKAALSAPSIMDQIGTLFGGMPGGAEAMKSFTAGNLGIGSVSGLVPFDLLAPSRLIYPVCN